MPRPPPGRTISQRQGEKAAAVSIQVVPPKVLLRGPDSVQQLAVEAIGGDSAARDESAGAKFTTSDPKVAEIDAPLG